MEKKKDNCYWKDDELICVVEEMNDDTQDIKNVNAKGSGISFARTVSKNNGKINMVVC